MNLGGVSSENVQNCLENSAMLYTAIRTPIDGILRYQAVVMLVFKRLSGNLAKSRV
jgi:hypothetical protein